MEETSYGITEHVTHCKNVHEELSTNDCGCVTECVFEENHTCTVYLP